MHFPRFGIAKVVFVIGFQNIFRIKIKKSFEKDTGNPFNRITIREITCVYKIQQISIF